MDIQLLSKKNMSGCAMLLLLVLMGQSRIFDFLFVTALGRAILILFILGISYLHKILGVVAVLFIIIMFNQRNENAYFEGFSTKPVAKQKPNKNVAREGFNIVDREGTILRGKRSNTVPVFSKSLNKEDDDVEIEPMNNSIFANSYSMI